MNKTDALNMAQNYDEMGIDPDNVMVTYTLDELSKMHGDEVDTYDEDKAEINQIRDELYDIENERLSIGEAIDQIESKIKLLYAEIDINKNIADNCNNWAQAAELREENRDYYREITRLQGMLEELRSRQASQAEHFEKEEARLLKELEEAKKRFDQKYAR